jgi:hypothetical protein
MDYADIKAKMIPAQLKQLKIAEKERLNDEYGNKYTENTIYF